MYSQEGTTTRIVSKNELNEWRLAQRNTINDGVIALDSNKLQLALSPFFAVLSFIAFKFPTPVGLSLSAVSLGLSLIPNAKDSLDTSGRRGEDWLDDLYEYMGANPQYDLIEIKYPYLKYFDVNAEGEDLTFITGIGIITKMHTNNGWIVA